MAQRFAGGDNLIFQLESGFGLVRVLNVEVNGLETIWHLLTYEDLFPDIESAEQALTTPERLQVGYPHLALTSRAFERTPTARLNNRLINADELAAVQRWQQNPEAEASDRSLLQLLGMR